MIDPNRVGASREVLPEWGVDWQTKDLSAMGYPHPLTYRMISFMQSDTRSGNWVGCVFGCPSEG